MCARRAPIQILLLLRVACSGQWLRVPSLPPLICSGDSVESCGLGWNGTQTLEITDQFAPLWSRAPLGGPNTPQIPESSSRDDVDSCA